MNFIRRSNRGNFYLSCHSFDDLLAGWKFATKAKVQPNISNILPAKPKKTQANGDIGCQVKSQR